jgi:hypothetical protein
MFSNIKEKPGPNLMEHPRSQQQTYGIGLFTIIRSYTNPRVHSYRWYPQSDSEERNRRPWSCTLRAFPSIRRQSAARDPGPEVDEARALVQGEEIVHVKRPYI